MSTEYNLLKVDLGESYGLGRKWVWTQIFDYEKIFALRDLARDINDLGELLQLGFTRDEEQTEKQFAGWARAIAESIWIWAADDRLAFNNEYTDVYWKPELLLETDPSVKFIHGRYRETGSWEEAASRDEFWRSS